MPQRIDWPAESWRIGTVVYWFDGKERHYEAFDVSKGYEKQFLLCHKGSWHVIENIIVHVKGIAEAYPQFGSEEELDTFLNQFEETSRLELRDKYK